MRKLFFALIALTPTLPTYAADALLDAYAAQKTRIAAKYQAATQDCAKHVVAVRDACHNAAQVDRRNALQAASRERDTGLKCRDTCGYVAEVKRDAASKPAHGNIWHVSYALYNGQTASTDFTHDPKLAAGDKIKLQDGKLSKR